MCQRNSDTPDKYNISKLSFSNILRIQTDHIMAIVVLLQTLTLNCNVYAASYNYPEGNHDVIGKITTTRVLKEQTLLDIARQNDIGWEDISLANPGLSIWLPDINHKVILPTQFILPKAQRSGVVINLPEMRLYHYQMSGSDSSHVVKTYPVSIGQQDWQTPLGQATITRKRKNPIWTPPESIKKEALSEGVVLPDIVPAGPTNPLGDYALSLNKTGYLLHGTNRPLGIGARITHGCIRLYPEDIEELFHNVSIGTEVHIINEPVKLGRLNNELYLEVHPPLVEFPLSDAQMLEIATQMLLKEIAQQPTKVHSSLLRRTVKYKTGIPVNLTDNRLF